MCQEISKSRYFPVKKKFPATSSKTTEDKGLEQTKGFWRVWWAPDSGNMWRREELRLKVDTSSRVAGEGGTLNPPPPTHTHTQQQQRGIMKIQYPRWQLLSFYFFCSLIYVTCAVVECNIWKPPETLAPLFSAGFILYISPCSPHFSLR